MAVPLMVAVFSAVADVPWPEAADVPGPEEVLAGLLELGDELLHAAVTGTATAPASMPAVSHLLRI
jgi:hypothetical protein